jgi:hypothetical protein
MVLLAMVLLADTRPGGCTVRDAPEPGGAVALGGHSQDPPDPLPPRVPPILRQAAASPTTTGPAPSPALAQLVGQPEICEDELVAEVRVGPCFLDLTVCS